MENKLIKLLIASDHAGFGLKKKLMEYFKNKFEFNDFGTNSEESVDYPDFAHKLANEISIKNLSLDHSLTKIIFSTFFNINNLSLVDFDPLIDNGSL